MYKGTRCRLAPLGILLKIRRELVRTHESSERLGIEPSRHSVRVLRGIDGPLPHGQAILEIDKVGLLQRGRVFGPSVRHSLTELPH